MLLKHENLCGLIGAVNRRKFKVSNAYVRKKRKVSMTLVSS